MPHLVYLAIGFPPAAKSSAYRMKAVANAFAARGWDVTVISLADESWEREMGLDPTLLDGLSPRVRRVGLPLARYDLATDLREYTREQALHFDDWLAEQSRLDREVFPEAIFGRWLEPLTEAAVQAHTERTADLIMASPGPYVTLGAGTAASKRTGVPLALDYRDGWCVDVVTGKPTFDPADPEGVVEAAALHQSVRTWFVNDAIRGFYAERYPQVADRFRTVRNGFDGDLTVPDGDPHDPLRLGYLGTLTLRREQLESLLRAWRLARLASPLLAQATLEFRGHLGTRTTGANRNQRLLARYAAHGVHAAGPVPKAEVAAVYQQWDCLVLALIGAHYVTSGKVYEYVATGLPIVSAHDPDSAAAEVLAGYPRWFRNTSMSEEDLALAFVAAAEGVRCPAAVTASAREYAARYAREALTDAAVADLVEQVGAT